MLLLLNPHSNRWDYSNSGYLDALKHLADLKAEGPTEKFPFLVLFKILELKISNPR